MTVQMRLQRLETSVARYRALFNELKKLFDEFDESAEPRSYAHAYEQARNVVRGFRP